VAAAKIEPPILSSNNTIEPPKPNVMIFSALSQKSLITVIITSKGEQPMRLATSEDLCEIQVKFRGKSKKNRYIILC
jgi:hypothetical protein